MKEQSGVSCSLQEQSCRLTCPVPNSPPLEAQTLPQMDPNRLGWGDAPLVQAWRMLHSWAPGWGWGDLPAAVREQRGAWWELRARGWRTQSGGELRRGLGGRLGWAASSRKGSLCIPSNRKRDWGGAEACKGHSKAGVPRTQVHTRAHALIMCTYIHSTCNTHRCQSHVHASVHR